MSPSDRRMLGQALMLALALAVIGVYALVKKMGWI